MNQLFKRQSLTTLVVLACTPCLAYATDDIETLQRKVDRLQLQVTELQQATPMQSAATAPLSAVHLSGYAAVGYTDVEHGDGGFNSVSFNPIFHYQYSDLILLEAELEIAVEDDGSTETALEYGAIDWFISDHTILQTGKFLSPIGYFRQNLHPAWINKFASAPPGFSHDGAAPLAEVGAQVRGAYRVGESGHLNYALFMGNGPKIEIVGAEIAAVGTEGTTGNDDDKLVMGGRLGLLPFASLEIGVSGAAGDSGPLGEEALLRDYRVYGSDLSWKPGKGWDFRGEYVKSKVGSNTASAAPDSAEWTTWYVQGAYRFLPSLWEAVVRYGDFNSPHDGDDQKQWGVGMNYWVAPNAVAKIDFENNKGNTGSASDDNRVLLQLAYGF